MATKHDNEKAALLATITSLNETIVSLKQMIADLQKTNDKLTQELLSMNNQFNLFFGKKTAM